MFTLLVSWLLVACIPWLLMLATHGLGRLEEALAHASVTAHDVAKFLDQAEAVDVHTLVREGMPTALNCLHRRQAERLADAPPITSRGGKHHAEPFFASSIAGLGPNLGEAGLPTRVRGHSRANTQSGATRHVNRV